MAENPVIDSRALFRTYLTWRRQLLLILGFLALTISSVEPFSGDRLQKRRLNLEVAGITATDPLVSQEVKRQIALLEGTWRYQARHVMHWGPMLLGFGLMMPLFLAANRGRRALAWASHGRCAGCGYDLRGSGVWNSCPECDRSPAPLQNVKPVETRRSRRLMSVAMRIGGFIMFMVVLIGVFVLVAFPRGISGIPGASFFDMRAEKESKRAFADAPYVVARWTCVIGANGSMQHACVFDRVSDGVRQEWWTKGTLEETMVLPGGPDCRRYLPDRGIVAQPIDALPLKLRARQRMFTEINVPSITGAIAYRSEPLRADGRFKVYRRVDRAGIHEHHASKIEISVIDAATDRPLYQWSGTFTTELDPSAVPTLETLWITEISYPDSIDGALLQLDADRPGRLRQDVAMDPDWLDRTWVDPILPD